MSTKRRPIQLTLPTPAVAPTNGGRRAGAGRKVASARPRVRHLGRPAHDHRHPVHVSMRVRREAGFLRQQRVLAAVVARLRRASENDFRVLHYSVQTDHLHLIVEAADGAVLARRMTGLGTWLARSVNRVLGRRGRFFADRYHRQDLKSPRQVRNALVYVLQNHRKHARQRLGRDVGGVDAYSSGPWFEGFAEDATRAADDARRRATKLLGPASGPLGPPTTWLAGKGWLKARGGRIAIAECPGRARRL